MRRTLVNFRGSSGVGWYQKFLKEGQEGFRKHPRPTPFDWTLPEGQSRPKAFFDIKIDEEPAGRLVFELAEDIVPKCVENFKRLCQNEVKGYQGTNMFSMFKKKVLVGGDVEKNDGSSSHSAFDTRFFQDENFIIPHSERGLISYLSVGLHTNGSQFQIILNPNGAPHLDGRCMVFGRVVQGEDVLERIEKVFAVNGKPSLPIQVERSGLL